MNNNPINTTDPTGHVSCVGENADDGPQCFTSKYLWAWGITANGASESESNILARAASLIGDKLSRIVKTNSQDAFRMVEKPITIDIGKGNGPSSGDCETNLGSIACNYSPNLQTAIHEMGHEFDQQYKAKNIINDEHLASNYLTASFINSAAGFMCDTYPCEEHPGSDPNLSTPDSSEQFADLFLNWVLDGNPAYPLNGFNYKTDAGVTWSQWMNGTSLFYTGVGMPIFLQHMGY